MGNKYTLLYICRNCGHIFTEDFKKEEDHAREIIRCPICLINDAIKVTLGHMLLKWDRD